MTSTLSPTELKERYKKLPQDVAKAMSSVDVTGRLEEIGKKYGLHIDQTGMLVDETGLVMLGVIHPRDFIGSVAQRLNLPEDKARAIATDINEGVFRPIRESLKKIHEIPGDPGFAKSYDDANPPPPKAPFTAKQAFEPVMPEKGGEVPENLPSETAGEPAPGTEEEYPITEPIESKAELLEMIENGGARATPTPTKIDARIGSGAPPALTQGSREGKPDIVKTRLQETTHTPHEKVEHYGGEDPYREPIE